MPDNFDFEFGFIVLRAVDTHGCVYKDCGKLKAAALPRFLKIISFCEVDYKMPGLSQLNKFNSDILALGNEAELRAQRGEKVVSFPVPKNVKDVDDSDDFVMGLADFMAEPVPEQKNTAEDEDLSDITGSSSASRSAQKTSAVDMPDVSSLVGGNPDGTVGAGGIPDLSQFLDEEPAEQDAPIQEEKKPDIADLSLDDLLGGSGFDETQGFVDAPAEQEQDAGGAFASPEQSGTDDLFSNNKKHDFDESVLQNVEHDLQTEDSIPSLEDALGLDDGGTTDFGEEKGGGSEETLSSGTTSPAADTDGFDLPESDFADFDEPPSQLDTKDDGIEPGQMFSLDDIPSLSESEAAGAENAHSDTDTESKDSGSSAPAEQTPLAADADFFDPQFDEPFFDDLPEPAADTAAGLNASEDFSLPPETESFDNAVTPEQPVLQSDMQDMTDEPPLSGDEATDGAEASSFNADIDNNGPGAASVSANSENAETAQTSLSADTETENAPDVSGGSTDAENASIMPGQMFSLDDLTSLSDSTGSDNGGSADDLFTVPGGNSAFSDFDTQNAPPIDLGFESPELDDFQLHTKSEAGTDGLSLPDTEDDSAPGTDASADEAFNASADDFSLPEDSPDGFSGDFNLPNDAAASALSGDSQTAAKNADLDGGADFSSLNFDDNTGDSFGLDSGAANLADTDNAPLPENVTAGDFDDAFTLPAQSTDGADAGDDFPSDFDFNVSESASDDAAPMSADENVPMETFDTSELAGMEFPETDAQIAGGGLELDNADNVKLDSGDFEIRGFTDVDTVAEGKNGKMKLPEAEISQPTEEGDLPPNTLSDADYQKFLKNLSSYPLNVRLAVEDLIIKNEFTDEAEFEIVQKVLKKVPARQLASQLEKMLDISIPVPRDFERRTAAEYEAYKASFQYQLRNKIIPGALMSMVGAVLVGILFLFSKFYIYEPAVANHLYRQGYKFLEAGDYPPSEEKFNKAVTYNLQKKWFFKYARGYRAHKQYARAEQVYKALLYAFKFDKTAGLEYAEMEMNDLADYAKAEEIVLRDVLDHHVNDLDGILLLGDVYLEWATEKDPSKFDMARSRYTELMEKNKVKSKNLFYLSRMLRYYIRTDNLLEVLQLKENFMPKAKSLGAEDWTELSGYLLDKLYGTLAPSDEYLRNKIEDVKETLVRAVKANPENPVAFYNMSRYYVQMRDGSKAKDSLKHTIDLFAKARTLKKRDMYKNIDSYRLLGEGYKAEREYLKALEAYTGGITLFTEFRDTNGLTGNAQVGNLYGDMGDMEFFVSGELGSALLAYQDAVDNFYDTPEIRYKIGFIQYGKRNYAEALGSFMKALEDEHSDRNLLLAMGNTLSMREDNYAAQGYYERLMEYLDTERAQRGVLFPQTRSDEQEIVDLYLKASNNLGVTLYRLARRTGDSSLNAQAMVNFQESMRAWDALTRNQTTMVRLGGSNLAEQNMKFVSHPLPEYEPAIYTALPRTLSGEKEFGK